MTSSSVLLWPTRTSYSIPGLQKDEEYSVLDKPGYILGWDDIDDDSNDLKITDTTTTATQSIAANNKRNYYKNRTTICIGIIPKDKLQWKDENEIRQLVDKWAKQYACDSVNNNIDSDNNETNSCRQHCIRCICHGQIKIIGVWKAEATEKKSVSKHQLSEIIPTPYGPWWRDEHENENDDQQQQLLLYDPCENLSHFRHCFPWNTYQSATMVLEDSHVQQPCTGFEKILVRLNEGHEIFESLQNELVNNSKNKIEPRNVTFEVVQNHNTRPPVDEMTDTSSISCLLQNSLLAIHSSRGEQSRPPFLQPFSGLLGFFRLLLLSNSFESSSIWRHHHNSNTPQKSSGPWYAPRDRMARQCIRFYETQTSIALDGILGLVVGFLVIYHVDVVQQIFKTIWDFFHMKMLRNNIGWLETFPVGFKLNVALTQSMGTQISFLLNLHDFMTSSILTLLDAIGGGIVSMTEITTAATIPSSQQLLLMGIGCIGCTFGFLTMIAFVFDILRMVTVHIYCFVTVFQHIHQWQLYLLSSLWRLFRGKKKNVLRHRTDTMDYDYMQLLLGMILFTAVLFIFTTILVYYMFFTVLNLTIHAMYVALWILYVLVQDFPLGTVILRIRNPSWFTRKVFIQDCETKDLDNYIEESALLVLDATATKVHAATNEPPTKRDCGKLEAVPQSVSEIISEAISHYFKSLLSSIPSLIGEIICGKPCSILEVCLKHIHIPKESK